MMHKAVQNAGRTLLCLCTSFCLVGGSGVWGGLTGVSDAAAFEIRVRAQSQLMVDVAAAGTSLQVRGQLRDDLQQSLQQREVAIYLTPASTSETISHRLFTDRRGQFGLTQELAPDFYHVTVEFLETEHLDASVSMHEIEIQAHPARLNLHAPAYVHGSVTSAPLAVHAFVQNTGLASVVWVRQGAQPAASLQLDRFGRGTLDVQPMLEPGLQTLEVLLPASAYREEVRQTIGIRRGDRLRIRAGASSVLERLERGIHVEGKVTDEFGDIENLSLRVIVRPKESGPDETNKNFEITRTIRSDADGAFQIFIPSTELADGQWFVHVEALPDAGPSWVEYVGTVEVDAAISQRILWWSAGIVVLAFLGFVGQRIFMHLQARRRAREKIQAARSTLEQALRSHENIQVVALSEAEWEDAAFSSASSSANDLTRVVAGLVWDAWQQKPVPGATLSFRLARNAAQRASEESAEESADGAALYREITSDAGGRFLLDELPAGDYRLVVKARGFVRTELSFQIPHSGTLARFRLDLTAVPLKIRQVYQATMQTIHGEDLWGQRTPRQIKELVARTLALDATQAPDIHERLQASADDPAEVLRTLTELVEESYFSGRQYDEELWNIARELALALLQYAEENNRAMELS